MRALFGLRLVGATVDALPGEPLLLDDLAEVGEAVVRIAFVAEGRIQVGRERFMDFRFVVIVHHFINRI